MNNAASIYTVESATTFVRVAEFRLAIEALEYWINERHSVCGAGERARWIEETRSLANKLAKLNCKRARKADWDRREIALDRSASVIGKYLFG